MRLRSLIENQAVSGLCQMMKTSSRTAIRVACTGPILPPTVNRAAKAATQMTPITSRLPRVERWAGRMNRDSTSERASTAITITGMTPRNLPIIPSTKNRGVKAATEVRIENTTGVPTSRVPSTAARANGFPCSRWA